MPTEKLLQNSFVNGQYDRSVQSKERTAFVGSGISKCLNVLSDEKGELRKRLGTKFLKEIVQETVLVPYRKGDNDLILAFSPNKMDVYEYSNGKLIDYIGSNDTQFIQTWTGNTTNGYTVGANYNNSTAYTAFVLPVLNTGVLPYRVNGWQYNGNNAQTALKDSLIYTITLPSDGIIGRLSFAFGCVLPATIPANPYIGYTDATLQYSDDNLTWKPCKTYIESEVGQSPKYQIFATPGFGDHGYKSAVIQYDIVLDEEYNQHKYWRVIFSQKLDHSSKSQAPTLNIQFYLRSSNIIPVTTSTDIVNIKNIKYSQDRQLLKIVDGEHNPKSISITSNISYADFLPIYTTTPNTVTIWENYGIPSSVKYFQNRLCFGGFTTNQNLVLCSKFDEETNFVPNTPAQYDDALILKSNELKSRIDNLTSGQNILYCFSEDGISFIDGGSTGLLATNQNIEFHLKNLMPAGFGTPTHKDDVLLYMSSDGTKLYSVEYDLLISRFQVDDVAKYAKDITTNKIDNLQYVNNESKLVYGLLNNGKMFALNYNKQLFQGFFPIEIQDGYVYDILAIKIGRNYKLLMVTNRGGYWCIEEKLDKGHYINSTDPLITNEERKWATYDNIQNNIALDCYQTYDESVTANVTINNFIAETTDDLSAYIGKSVMFGQLNNEKNWCIASIDSVASHTQSMYKMTTTATPYKSVYISTDTLPGDTNIPVYDENGKYLTFGVYNAEGTALLVFEDGEYTIYVHDDTVDIDVLLGYNITISATRGNADIFDIVFPEITTFRPNLPIGSVVGIIGEGKYFGNKTITENGVVLDNPAYRITYGNYYDAYAYLEVQRPYDSMKIIKQISLQVQDTMHLSVGTNLDDMQTLETINDHTYYDLTNMTMNECYRVVPGDTPEWTKYVILKSDKGLPFTVNAVEVLVNYSNEGGN